MDTNTRVRSYLLGALDRISKPTQDAQALNATDGTAGLYAQTYARPDLIICKMRSASMS